LLTLIAESKDWELQCLLLHLLKLAVTESLDCKMALLGWSLESLPTTELSLNAPYRYTAWIHMEPAIVRRFGHFCHARQHRLQRATARCQPLLSRLDQALVADRLALALSALQLETAGLRPL
jgi:hypothetical protein